MTVPTASSHSLFGILFRRVGSVYLGVGRIGHAARGERGGDRAAGILRDVADFHGKHVLVFGPGGGAAQVAGAEGVVLGELLVDVIRHFLRRHLAAELLLLALDAVGQILLDSAHALLRSHVLAVRRRFVVVCGVLVL